MLAQEPQRITSEGGVVKFLCQLGVTTIVANEINISAVFTKRTSGESDETFFEEGNWLGDGEVSGERKGSKEGSTADDICREKTQTSEKCPWTGLTI